MTNNLTHQHGGNLDAVEAQYGIPKEEIRDFSGNINPLGFPPDTAKALAENIAIVSRYPDRGYRALRRSIAAYTGADPAHIAVGNGSTELISTFIASVAPQKALIVGPAYSEYAHSVALCGGAFDYFPLREEEDFCLHPDRLLAALTPQIQLLVLCNPNNPTGTAVRLEALRQVLAHCKANGIAVMIDETYIEFSVDPAAFCAIPLVGEFDNLFVIRGTSKFFAAPGLRLGYGVCANQKFLENLAQKQDPWSVNSLAAFAGERLFREQAFMAETRDLILSERVRLLSELHRWPEVKVYPTASNFILLRLLGQNRRADVVTDALIRQKMLLRDCASFPFLDESYLRFCILLPEENTALLQALKPLLAQEP